MGGRTARGVSGMRGGMDPRFRERASTPGAYKVRTQNRSGACSINEVVAVPALRTGVHGRTVHRQRRQARSKEASGDAVAPGPFEHFHPHPGAPRPQMPSSSPSRPASTAGRGSATSSRTGRGRPHAHVHRTVVARVGHPQHRPERVRQVRRNHLVLPEGDPAGGAPPLEPISVERRLRPWPSSRTFPLAAADATAPGTSPGNASGEGFGSGGSGFLPSRGYSSLRLAIARR